MLRDALVVAAIAVVVVQVLRRCCGDRYVVPSDSMQPMLHGDEVHGDVVFVDKLASAADRRRHDLVVVEHPDKRGGQLVKRIAARGDDVEGGTWIDLRDGDVWLGDPDRLQRECKDPIEAARMQVAWATLPADAVVGGHLQMDAARRDGAEWILSPVALVADEVRTVFAPDAGAERRRSGRVVPSGFVGTGRSVDASYVEVTGVRGGGGRDVGVRDCGMTVELAAPADLLCTIDARACALTFCLRLASGDVQLWCNGRNVATTSLAWRPTASCRVEFAFLDDRAYCLVDGRRDAMFIVPRDASWAQDNEPGPAGPRTWLHFGAVGERPARIRGLRVFRDVFVWRERIAGLPDDPGQWPRSVPPGTWFLLGDNPFDSRDSRHFGPRSTSTFLGRPRFVLGPWPRGRWLDP